MFFNLFKNILVIIFNSFCEFSEVNKPNLACSVLKCHIPEVVLVVVSSSSSSVTGSSILDTSGPVALTLCTFHAFCMRLAQYSSRCFHRDEEVRSYPGRSANVVTLKFKGVIFRERERGQSADYYTCPKIKVIC